MHQQVRSPTTKTGTSSPGPGAMADEGGLLDILQLLAGDGISMRAAGGRDLDQGGVFAFAVEDHGEEKAQKLLEKHGYAAQVVDVKDCEVADKAGSLLDCIRSAEEDGFQVYEIFVGTPATPGGPIPIQLTSRESVSARTEAS